MATPKLKDEVLESILKQGLCTSYKDVIKRQLRINDEQIAVNRFKWYNLPKGITGNMIERILYYRGQAAMFYIKPLNKFVFLPFVMQDGIDIYGRYVAASPVPFNGKGEVDKDYKPRTPQEVMLSTIKAQAIYSVVDFRDLTEELLTNSCVILTDYTRQESQRILPRQSLNEGIIDIESNMIPYMNTALMLSTGVSGMRVNDASEQSNVELASRQVNNAALNGNKWIALTSQLELQELTGGGVAKANDYLLAMQSLDNFRLGTYGVDNGGMFEKKQYTNEAELGVNVGSSSFTMLDGLYNRQLFADICNSLWGWNCYVEASEVSTGIDSNFDGQISNYDENFNTMEEISDEQLQ